MGSQTQYASIVHFDNSKGYGFAKLHHAPQEGRQVIIHHSEVEGEGYVSLYAGDELMLEVCEVEGKLRGRNIRVRRFV